VTPVGGYSTLRAEGQAQLQEMAESRALGHKRK
jgi:hypothetical protein